MNVNRLRLLCIEIYKTINNLSLRETSRLIRKKYMLNLNMPVRNHITFRSKNLRVFGPKAWNYLPYHIKSSKNLESFKMIIKHWNVTRWNCKVCITP